MVTLKIISNVAHYPLICIYSITVAITFSQSEPSGCSQYLQQENYLLHCKPRIEKKQPISHNHYGHQLKLSKIAYLHQQNVLNLKTKLMLKL